LVLIPFEYFGRSIRIEEQLLEQYFGSTYLAYKKKVRRWL
jgi:protein-S-isoprenylcysteine O-methyltransferase Ste14